MVHVFVGDVAPGVDLFEPLYPPLLGILEACIRHCLAFSRPPLASHVIYARADVERS